MRHNPKEVTKSSGGHYYASGRYVLKSPIEKEYADGTKGTQMGFRVCEADEWVEGAAEEIAKALNLMEGIEVPNG